MKAVELGGDVPMSRKALFMHQSDTTNVVVTGIHENPGLRYTAPLTGPSTAADAYRTPSRRLIAVPRRRRSGMTFPGGFGPPSRKVKSVIARMANRVSDHSDQELHERACVMMKQTPLFRRMSWRLLGDLVAVEGLRVAHDASDPTVLDFSVLVVLEGTLIVRTTAPAPPFDKVVELPPGVYLKSDPVLVPTPPDAKRTIEAPLSQELRYYALTPETLRRLPTQVLAGMDATTLPTGELEVLL
jgi:hypothetical protein